MECHGSIGSVRSSSSVDTATRREQVDAHLQASGVAAAPAWSSQSKTPLGPYVEKLQQPSIPSLTTRDRVDTRSAELRYGSKFVATAQSSFVGIWSSSVNETQISTKRKFIADDFCPLRVERVSVRRLTEDGHERVVVCAKPIPAEIIIRVTRRREVLFEKSWIPELTPVQKRLMFPEYSVEFSCGEDRESCQSRVCAGVILAVQTSVSLVDDFAAMSSVST